MTSTSDAVSTNAVTEPPSTIAVAMTISVPMSPTKLLDPNAVPRASAAAAVPGRAIVTQRLSAAARDS